MRVGLLCVTLLLGSACAVRAAPAPFPTPGKEPPKLPDDVKRVLWALTEVAAQNIKFTRDHLRDHSEKGRKICRADIARREQEIYTEPVKYLKTALTLPWFRSPNDQRAAVSFVLSNTRAIKRRAARRESAGTPPHRRAHAAPLPRPERRPWLNRRTQPC